MEAHPPRTQGLFLQLGLPLVGLVLAAVWLFGCDTPESQPASTPTATVADALEPELPSPTDGPFHEFAFEAALSWAERTGRPVVVDFFTTWCGPCKQLDRTTWREPDVVRWLTERTIALKIDADEQKALAQSYRIRGYPTVLVLDADGKEKRRLLGLGPIQSYAQNRAKRLADGASTDDD